MLVLLLAQLAVTSPAPTRFELPNGLRVWVQEDHSRPVALVHVTYHAGSLNEGPGTTGVAHYVEHMVYRATENIRNEDIYGYIDRIGGRYTGGTWPDVTRYAETVPSWALESALRVTAERMTRALFDSLEFERERSNIVTEAHGFADLDPGNALRDAVMMAAFGLHPYRYSSNSWARDNLTLTRAQAHAWYKAYYGPNNAVLVVVGDVKTDSVRALVTKHFGPLRRAPESGRIAVVEPTQRAEKRVLMTEPSDSARLEIVYHAPSAFHPAFPVLVRFGKEFSGGIRAAAMSVDSSVRVTVRDTATAYPHVFRIAVAAAPSVNMTSVLAAIDRNIQALQGGEFERIEVVRGLANHSDRADSTVSASAVPPRQSSLTRIAEALAARELPPWEVSQSLRDSIAARAQRVSRREYAEFARQWLKPSNRTIGILQPGTTERPTPRLRIGTPPASAAPDTTRFALDIPALTTPPAKRLRPQPVPLRALRPLAPLPMTLAKRTLGNGIVVRAARTRSAEMVLRIVSDYGATQRTMERRFSPDALDSVLRSVVPNVTSGFTGGPEVAPDSSLEGQARARVIAAVSAPRARYSGDSAAYSVAVAGPVDPSMVVEIATKHFSALPRSRPLERRPYRDSVDAGVEQIRVTTAKQVEIVAGLPAVHRDHPDRRALELLNYIVGVPYYGGRLGWALTKSGLTYSSAAQSYFGESGHLLFNTTADTRNTPATIQAIREVIAGVGEGDIPQWELKEAQAFMLGRTILYGVRETASDSVIAKAMTDSDSAGVELLDLPALSRAYLSVTPAELNRVARKYYRPEKLKIVAIGAIPTPDMASPFAPGTFRALFAP